jgi:hypothetical protein
MISDSTLTRGVGGRQPERRILNQVHHQVHISGLSHTRDRKTLKEQFEQKFKEKLEKEELYPF